MSNSIYTSQEETVQYSKVFSSLFCSISIIALSLLCLLNNFTIDLYSMLTLLKVVLPASFCFWFLGYVIGKKLDNIANGTIVKHNENKNNTLASAKPTEAQAAEGEEKTDEKAYEITSMFANNAANLEDDEFGGLI